METIKCGRMLFDLANGATVMDNGKSLQLITSKIHKGFTSWSPSVSKAEFAKFRSNKNVSVNNDHGYGPDVTLYTYQKYK